MRVLAFYFEKKKTIKQKDLLKRVKALENRGHKIKL